MCSKKIQLPTDFYFIIHFMEKRFEQLCSQILKYGNNLSCFPIQIPKQSIIYLRYEIAKL